MTLVYTVKPLTDPTSLAGKKTVSDFTATWSDTLAVLERELRHLRARDVVFELDVLPGQLTKAGQVKANSRAASGAVRISFETADLGTLSYGTAAFTRGPAKRWRGNSLLTVMSEDWQHNVRAIALGLEALRRVDRYGIGAGRQYAGWAALPAGSGATPLGGMTREQAIEKLHDVAGLGGRFTDLRIPWKKARANAHPDRHDGDRTAWDLVEQAATVLGLS